MYASRFIGARGYLVTYRLTDPLYILDLSDTADPKVAGALEDRLLAVQRLVVDVFGHHHMRHQAGRGQPLQAGGVKRVEHAHDNRAGLHQGDFAV